MTRAITLAMLAALVMASAALASGPCCGLPPLNAPAPVIAGQFLKEISELKAHDITIRCVTFPNESPGVVIYGMAQLRGQTLYLSTRYVCGPLVSAYKAEFTPGYKPPFASLDAIETVAHEWFHTRGVASEERTECHAVQYTWKWVRRSEFGPTYAAKAKRHLLDNSRRPPEYKIPAMCLGA